MTNTDDSDYLLEAFSRKIAAKRNLKSLETGDKSEKNKTIKDFKGRKDEEEDRPIFKTGNV